MDVRKHTCLALSRRQHIFLFPVCLAPQDTGAKVLVCAGHAPAVEGGSRRWVGVLSSVSQWNVYSVPPKAAYSLILQSPSGAEAAHTCSHDGEVG